MYMLSDSVLRDELTNDALLKPVKFKFETFTDNHMHLDPRNGEGLAAVKKFQRAGGRYIFLVCKTTRDMGIALKSAESFERLYDHTVQLAAEINEGTEVRAFPVIGVHPAEVVEMCREFSAPKAVEVAVEALEIAGDKVREGEAVAIGEVGRPHFEVETEVMRACDEVLRHALKVARDADCAVQIHAGDEKGVLFAELKCMADEAKINPKRVIKHFSSPCIRAASEAGIYPSIVATMKNVTEAREEGNRFLMESDYIDDLRRPGAVVGPKSVPRLSQRLVDEGVLSEEDLWRIHVDNIERAYGIILD
jgi:TatD-related deoxyribonuclease